MAFILVALYYSQPPIYFYEIDSDKIISGSELDQAMIFIDNRSFDRLLKTFDWLEKELNMRGFQKLPFTAPRPPKGNLLKNITWDQILKLK